jgi:DNA-binding protein H-NS
VPSYSIALGAKELAKLSLKKMSVSELVSLRDRIQSALSEKIEQERADLQSQMDDLRRLEKLPGETNGAGQSRKGTRRKAASAKPQTRNRRKVAPKYRGPKGETWTGRGLAPRWLAALEAQGKKRESFLIKG